MACMYRKESTDVLEILCAEWGMRGSRRACVTGWVGLPSGEGYRESKLEAGQGLVFGCAKFGVPPGHSEEDQVGSWVGEHGDRGNVSLGVIRCRGCT